MKSKLSKLAIVVGAAVAGALFTLIISGIGSSSNVTTAGVTKFKDGCNEGQIYDPSINSCKKLELYQGKESSFSSDQNFNNVEVKIAAAVNNLIPNLNLQAQDISYIESADLYAFMLGKKLFFTTENVKSLISGDVLDLEMLKSKPERANITAEFQRIYNGGVSEANNGKSEYNIAALDTTKTINIGPNSAAKKFAVMFDISCPKSKDLYPKLVALSASNPDVQFNLMLISRTASQSVERKSKEIFCTADKLRALDFYVKTSIQDQSQPQLESCSFNPDYPAILMGDQFSGTTPVFYNADNKVLVGNKDIKLIQEYISK